MRYFPYTNDDINQLIKLAPSLTLLIKHYGKIKREIYSEPFHALIGTIISQQLNTKVAKSIEDRLFNEIEISPNNLSSIEVNNLKEYGLSMAKINAIKQVSSSIVANIIPFNKFKDLSNQEITDYLTSIKGIGNWTAAGFLIFGMKRKNVWMAKDLILMKSIKLLNISETEVSNFMPYATIASFYLWAFGNNPRYGISINSPIGQLTIVEVNKKIVNVTLENIALYINEETPLLAKAKTQLNEYFNKERIKFTLPIELASSPFYQAIYQEMLKIPYGKTSTYKTLCTNIKKPHAQRATGQVCNKNPILIIIPCHRVLNSNNQLHGFAYGLEMKKYLLDLEAYSKGN